jgi:YidC/Oxa1 family membrane protein insertase
MDKNTFLAFLLIAIVLILTPYYLQLVAPPPPEPVAPVPGEDTTARRPQSPKPTPAATAEAPTLSPPVAGTPREPERVVTVDTDLYTARVSTRNGGSFQSFVLKQYTMFDTARVELINHFNRNNLLIRALTVDGDSLILDQNWHLETLGTRFNATVREQTLTFSTTVFGQPVTKTLTFSPGTYRIEVRVDLTAIDDWLSQGVYLLAWNGGLPSTEKNHRDDLFYFHGYAYQGGEVDDNTKLDKDKFTRRKMPGATDWVAVRTKYFVSALIPKPNAIGAEISGRKVDGVPLFNVALLQNAGENQSFTLYLGPLEYSRIKALEVDLDRAMTFGWAFIRPISRGVHALLVYLHNYIPNYGVVLVLFSILVKIVVYPLTKKSYQSSRQMQVIQPRLMALREKYKNDPQKLNKATMELYKEHGVNPLGGCLPLLLQMPIFIALFQVFRSTIELRGAPFVLWIKDLSAPDTLVEIGGFPINILPLLMAATMLVQQRMTPTTQAPGQQKMMMYVMNVVFLFIFYRFPSGLNLYYTLFNLLTILQQKLMTPHHVLVPTEGKTPAKAKAKK